MVCDGARVERRLVADVDEGGRLLVRDHVALGRSGERGGSLECHTELGYGAYADGGPLDPLLLTGEERRAVPPFAREPIDLHALAPAITAPTLVISGSQDLVSPTRVARGVAGRIPGAQLLEIRGAGHSMLDTRSRILLIYSSRPSFASNLIPLYL